MTDTINKLIEITGGEFPISDGEQVSAIATATAYYKVIPSLFRQNQVL